MFKELKLEQLLRITSEKPVLVEVRGLYDATEVERMGFVYRTL
jgi:hypothetical protein